MNTISGFAGDGTIGYVEYSYPLNKGYPVVKVLNKGGYYVEPTQYNTAVALTKARINTNKSDPTKYLTQILDDVYTNPDPRAYPISSYSYMIIPTAADDPRMTTAKRQSLADFLYYSLCAGQTKAGPLRLLAAAAQPGAGRLRPDRRAEEGRPRRRPHRPRRPQLQQPDLRRQEPEPNVLAETPPLPADVRQAAGEGPAAPTPAQDNPAPAASERRHRRPAADADGDGAPTDPADTGDGRRHRSPGGHRVRRPGGAAAARVPGAARSTRRPARPSAGRRRRRRHRRRGLRQLHDGRRPARSTPRPSAGSRCCCWSPSCCCPAWSPPGSADDVGGSRTSRRVTGRAPLRWWPLAVAASASRCPASDAARRPPRGRPTARRPRPTTASPRPRRSRRVFVERRRHRGRPSRSYEVTVQGRPDPEPARPPAHAASRGAAPSPAAAGRATPTARRACSRSTRSSSCSAAAATTPRCRSRSSCGPRPAGPPRSPSARRCCARTSESTWLRDLYADEADKQRVSGIDPIPADECPTADIAPLQHRT